MRYPKTPDFDIMSGVHIVRSLHVKNEKKCNSAFNSTTDLEEAKKPTWLVFDKQVNKPQMRYVNVGVQLHNMWLEVCGYHHFK